MTVPLKKQRDRGNGLHLALTLGLAIGASTLACVFAIAADTKKRVLSDAYPGGAATLIARTMPTDVFSQASANMGFARELDFKVGNGLFRKLWVSSPASTRSSDGLGPLFNARGCQSCHIKDGRGRPPASDRPEDRSVSLLVRLSIPPVNDEQRHALADGSQAVIPEPVYGSQLQEIAVQGHAGEGRLIVRYEDVPVVLAGGEIVTLRRPHYEIADLGYGPLAKNVMLSPRLTPQMIGLGLLEAIPEADILARADPDDTDKDGISGRPNRAWSPDRQEVMLGRFGWKAGQPTVLDQTADAFAGDIGISSALVPHPAGDCTQPQSVCRDAPHGGSDAAPNVEIDRTLLDLVAFYGRNLAVPARRTWDAPDVMAGQTLFTQVGCARCHTPHHVTGHGSPDPHLRGQTIWPYTDLLLHDMGDGLADGRPEGQASGREWRTPPLWGLGLIAQVNGAAFFLHDGRARNITEAILWHGGEAESARDRFAGLAPDDHAKLIAFVNSL